MDQYRTRCTGNMNLTQRNELSLRTPDREIGPDPVGTAIAERIAYSFGSDKPRAPRAPDDQHTCPERFRIATNALTERERHHITQCASCHDIATLFKDPTETPVARMVRWVRLWTVDWTPILLIAIIVSLVVLAIVSLRRDPRPDTRVEPRLVTAVPAETAAAIATQDDLAIKLSLQVGWPWNTCAVPGPYINRWLGQGQRRIEIEQRLRALEKYQGADPQQRQKAAAFWCQSLSAGTPQLLKLLRAETDRLNVPTAHNRNTNLTTPLPEAKPQPPSRHARSKVSRAQVASNPPQP